MNNPVWKEWPEECPDCPGDLEVFSDDYRDGWAWDGDPVRCCNCGIEGYISYDGEDAVYAVFPEVVDP